MWMGDTTCPTCGRDDFKSERGMKVHHSKVHNESIAGKIVECTVCGVEKRERKKRANKQDNFFCSHECFGEHLSMQSGEDHPNHTPRLVIDCEWCGDAVERTPSEVEGCNNIFCSHDCVAEYQSEYRTGDWSHLWEGGKWWVETVCENCGVEIEVSRWRFEQHEKNFCDHQCLGDYRAEGEVDRRYKYGELWDERREQRLDTDDYECKVCGIESDEHVEKYGMSLNVHHRTRYRSFEDEEEAHRLSNLVTLCCSCHRKVEAGKVEVESA